MGHIFEHKVFDWDNEGTVPDKTLQSAGFSVGYKPPAAYFNAFWSSVSKAIKELQEKLNATDENMNFMTSHFEGELDAAFNNLSERTSQLGADIEDVSDEMSGLPQMIAGSYEGNGEPTNIRFSGLGYKPRKIEIAPATAGNYSVATLIQDCPYASIMRSANESYAMRLEWHNNGVLLIANNPNSTSPTASSVVCETAGTTYHYIIYK